MNVGDEIEAVTEFTREHELTLPQLRDPKGAIWRKVDGRGLPVNLIWTHEGRRTDVGPKKQDEWRSELADLGCSARDQHPS